MKSSDIFAIINENKQQTKNWKQNKQALKNFFISL